MSLKCRQFYLLLFTTFLQLAIPTSQLRLPLESIGKEVSTELAPAPVERTIIRIRGLFEEKEEENEGEEEESEEGPKGGSAAPAEGAGQGKGLKKRELITAAVCLLTLVTGNLENMESAITAIASVLGEAATTLFGSGRKLPNGGEAFSDGAIKWFGNILEFEHDKVHVFVISPEPKVQQSVVIVGRRVFVNAKIVAQNYSFLGVPSYRKCEDKSLWYTNLTLSFTCGFMTKEEIEEFNEIQSQIEKLRDEAVKGVVNKALQWTAAGTKKALHTSAVLSVKAAKGIDEGGKKVARKTKEVVKESTAVATKVIKDIDEESLKAAKKTKKVIKESGAAAGKIIKDFDEVSLELAKKTKTGFGKFGKSLRRAGHSYSSQITRILKGTDPADLEDDTDNDSTKSMDTPKGGLRGIPEANIISRVDNWLTTTQGNLKPWGQGKNKKG